MNKPHEIGDIIEREDGKYTVTGIEKLQDLGEGFWPVAIDSGEGFWPVAIDSGEGFWPVAIDSKDYQYNPIIWVISVVNEHDEEFEMLVLGE